MKFLTTGEIAKRLNVDRDTVSYALRKMQIKPNGRAGLVRVFTEEAVEKIRQFIENKNTKAN